jgi:bifunctional non-homologous end joining protein LigD
MAGLKIYRSKRRFGITTEPKRNIARKRGAAFVIQKHAARRLHYDLRLELDGVMKSWAVTRGPSLVPDEKRLAVQVEDHPIDYNKFEGTIPQGEYGGGTVMVWDRGQWRPEGDPQKGLKKGHLSFDLDGEKLHGLWHLVRMHKRRGETRDNWLLIKAHDEAARTARDKDILVEAARSVKTGRTMDEIAEGAGLNRNASKTTVAKKRKTNRTKTKRKSVRIVPRNTSRAAAMPPLRKRSAVISPRPTGLPRAGARRAALPAFVAPSLATLVAKAPDGDDWIHEIKFDGYRLQARLDNGKVKLLTRIGLDWTRKFSPIAKAVAGLPAKAALIDGELVVEADDGISSFSLLQKDLKSGRHDRLRYYVFDLMHLDGADLRRLPLQARKETLAKLLKRASKLGTLRLSESIAERGPILLQHACQMGLEGIVSKRADAPYRSGRGGEWIKTKCSDRQEFVVAGFAPSTAHRRAVGALVLGFYQDGKLRYAGRTGTGFTQKSAREIYRKLHSIERNTTAFAALPAEERGARAPVWVDPRLVAEVDFHGWTHGGRVRQASFKGLREDKRATDVSRETKMTESRKVRAMAATNKAATAKRRSAPESNRNAKIAVAGVALSHPDRIYWKDAGVTKADLAEYYRDVWTWMRPHVAGRPISLLRCPEGAGGQCFFQKHAAAGIATEHLHLIPEKGDKIISIDDLDGLISLVQAGVLEIHTRGTTADDRDNADRLVFDLDPGPGTGWKDVVVAAREVRERLDAMKLTSFVKTSGGKGLHVVLPIVPTPWDKAKDFAKALAGAMAADAPDRYIATAAKSKRNKRIFIDYLRNSHDATAVAPYSTRARPGAPVSVPVGWEELSSLKGANQYTMLNLPARLKRLRKDPWAAIGRRKQKLPSIT